MDSAWPLELAGSWKAPGRVAGLVPVVVVGWRWEVVVPAGDEVVMVAVGGAIPAVLGAGMPMCGREVCEGAASSVWSDQGQDDRGEGDALEVQVEVGVVVGQDGRCTTSAAAATTAVALAGQTCRCLAAGIAQ